MADAGRFLPYGRQAVDDDDIAAVTAVLRGDWLTTGPAVDAFERAFAEATGARHAVSCANGTAALHLAAMAAGLGERDLAIVPSVTFLATANAVRFAGAEVVFADVDAETGLITAGTIDAALARLTVDERARVRAVLPVHLNGQVCAMAPIASAAAQRGWSVVEDACHALGARYDDGTPVGGAPATLACFSFHPVKTITTGEGGVVTTASDAMAERLARFRSHGMVRDSARFADAGAAFDASGAANPWYYEMPELGYNYRLSDIHAALGLQQLRKLARFTARRAELVARYDALLAPLAPRIRPIGRRPGARSAWHLYPVLVDFAALGIERGALMRRLRERGIGTQVHYIPVHRQPYYRGRYGAIDLPGAEAYYARVLSLPLFVGLTDDEVERTVGALREAASA